MDHFVGFDLCNQRDPAMQECGHVIYCCCPSAFLYEILNVSMQARYVRIHGYLSRCVRPITMGLYTSKEYGSI